MLNIIVSEKSKQNYTFTMILTFYKNYTYIVQMVYVIGRQHTTEKG